MHSTRPHGVGLSRAAAAALLVVSANVIGCQTESAQSPPQPLSPPIEPKQAMGVRSPQPEGGAGIPGAPQGATPSADGPPDGAAAGAAAPPASMPTRNIGGSAAAMPAGPGAAAPVAPGSDGPATSPSQASGPTVPVEVEQRLDGLRPELIDFLWNNLDSSRFEQWAPDAHLAFAWEKAPSAVGDLGAEPGATYRSTEQVAEQTHELLVTYTQPASPADPVIASGVVAADVMIDGDGPMRWEIAYELDGGGTLVHQSFELPEGLDAMAWAQHLEARIARLPMFLPEWFQSAFVEGELLTRGSSEVNSGAVAGTFRVVVEQRIKRLTPEMMDWWWDNIGDTYRYQRWHPTAHTSFEWITAPKSTNDLVYEPGAVQRVVETIDTSASLDITWLEPSGVPVPLTYEHFVYGSTALTGTPFGGFLLHEYDADPDGGIMMKSTFEIPSLAGMPFAESLADHCQQEMQFLQYFVPGLFELEYDP
ncbi:MAG: hypothetical protein OXU20_40465 [Myxococcales bacterium]|nr:hypothetical protein [Myxococcales bacterium]